MLTGPWPRPVTARRPQPWTSASSPGYHHAGLSDVPQDQLPSVTKADLMAHFDEAVTTLALRLADLENNLRSLTQAGGAGARPRRVPALRRAQYSSGYRAGAQERQRCHGLCGRGLWSRDVSRHRGVVSRGWVRR